MITILSKIIVIFVYSVTFKCIWKWLCGTEKYLGSCVSGPIKAHECLYIRIGIKTKNSRCVYTLRMPCQKLWLVKKCELWKWLNTFQRLYAVLCMCLQVVLFFQLVKILLCIYLLSETGSKLNMAWGKRASKLCSQNSRWRQKIPLYEFLFLIFLTHDIVKHISRAWVLFSPNISTIGNVILHVCNSLINKGFKFYIIRSVFAVTPTIVFCWLTNMHFQASLMSQ